MQTLIEGYNIQSIVTGDGFKPANTPTAITKWKKRETKVKVLLRMYVKNNIIPHIRECKPSTETQVVPNNLYEMANSNRIL